MLHKFRALRAYVKNLCWGGDVRMPLKPSPTLAMWTTRAYPALPPFGEGF